MNITRTILFILFVLCVSYTHSKEISLFSGDISFNVPDNYEEISVSPNSGIAYRAEMNNNEIALIAYRKGDFNVSSVLDNMDALLCDLSGFKLDDTEKEYVWDFTTDFVTRKYVSESGQKFASHIRYVTEGAYCFGFWYDTEDGFKDFQNLIKSVHFAEEDGIGQIKLAIKYTTVFLAIIIVLLIIASFFAGAGGSKNIKRSAIISLALTTVVAILFLIPMWHFWIAYLSLLGLFFVVCFICAMSGMHISFDV